MKVPLALVVAVVSGIVIPLQGATFYYVMSVEHRLTQVETMMRLTREPRLRLQAEPERERPAS